MQIFNVLLSDGYDLPKQYGRGVTNKDKIKRELSFMAISSAVRDTDGKIARKVEEIVDKYGKVCNNDIKKECLRGLLWLYYCNNGHLGKFSGIEFTPSTLQKLHICKKKYGNLNYF